MWANSINIRKSDINKFNPADSDRRKCSLLNNQYKNYIALKSRVSLINQLKINNKKQNKNYINAGKSVINSSHCYWHSKSTSYFQEAICQYSSKVIIYLYFFRPSKSIFQNII